jgi:hypothetical protein
MDTIVTQNIPNNLTQVVQGMPFKPATMAQGSIFTNARAAFLRKAGGGQSWFQSSDYTKLQTIIATGKSSTNPNGITMSFAGPDQTSVKTAIARCRGGGCVSPKKKGAQRSCT